MLKLILADNRLNELSEDLRLLPALTVLDVSPGRGRRGRGGGGEEEGKGRGRGGGGEEEGRERDYIVGGVLC